MKSRITRLILVVVGLTLVSTCQSLGVARTPLHASLITDLAEVTVHYRGHGYSANIGYTFTNTTGLTISRSGCGGPGSPDLEKQVGTRWTPAYYPVVLTCRTYPDFTWPSGAQIREALRFVAYERGQNSYPQINVDSIEGIYRLRWTFTQGREAGAKGARNVEADCRKTWWS